MRHRGWPADQVQPALRAVAADPVTKSPMRLAEAGPWWDEPLTELHADADLEPLEARLDALDGDRIRVPAAARAELSRDGLPLTRKTVLRRACDILDRRRPA